MTKVYQSQLGINVSRKDAEPGEKFIRVSVGQIVELSPACDLWMQGAKTAEIRRIYASGGITLRVRPIVCGVPQSKLASILPRHIVA